MAGLNGNSPCSGTRVDGARALGGRIALFLDGHQVGEGRIPASVPMVFSGDETTDVGYESASPVSEDYTMHTSTFNGKINWIQLDAGLDDHDHFIDPEERLRVVMARQ